MRRSSKECRKLIKELYEYKKGEKMEIKAKKTDLESMLMDIHESERSENRPLYIPPEGLGPNELSQKYRDLEEAEDEYENRLLKKFLPKKRPSPKKARFPTMRKRFLYPKRFWNTAMRMPLLTQNPSYTKIPP